MKLSKRCIEDHASLFRPLKFCREFGKRKRKMARMFLAPDVDVVERPHIARRASQMHADEVGFRNEWMIDHNEQFLPEPVPRNERIVRQPAEVETEEARAQRERNNAAARARTLARLRNESEARMALSRARMNGRSAAQVAVITNMYNEMGVTLNVTAATVNDIRCADGLILEFDREFPLVGAGPPPGYPANFRIKAMRAILVYYSEVIRGIYPIAFYRNFHSRGFENTLKSYLNTAAMLLIFRVVYPLHCVLTHTISLSGSWNDHSIFNSENTSERDKQMWKDYYLTPLVNFFVKNLQIKSFRTDLSGCPLLCRVKIMTQNPARNISRSMLKEGRIYSKRGNVFVVGRNAVDGSNERVRCKEVISTHVQYEFYIFLARYYPGCSTVVGCMANCGQQDRRCRRWDCNKPSFFPEALTYSEPAAIEPAAVVGHNDMFG